MIDVPMFFSKLLFTSFTASLLISIILVVKVILKEKISARWHYAIWFLLIVKLIIPNTFKTSFNLFYLFEWAASRYSVSQGVDGGSNFYELSLGNQDILNIWSFPEEYALSINGNHTTLLLQILFCIWLIGALCMVVWALIYNIKVWNMVKTSEPIEDKVLWGILVKCKEEMKIKKEFRMVESKNIRNPALFGILNPCILLPKNINSKLSLRELKYVMLHEMVHYKKKDIFFNMIACFLQVLHWFNPMIWYGLYHMREDQEIACDSYVLSQIEPKEHYDYGATLIKLLKTTNASMYTFTIANVLNNKRGIKKRIHMISKFRKESFARKMTSLILIVLMSFMVLTNSEGLSKNAYERPVIIPENTIVEDLSSHFQGYNGSFVLFDLNKEQYHIYNEKLSKERVSPCSTFKIVCSLMGLESGILKDENTKISWNGTIYPFEPWNKDQSLASAFTYSVNWYFETLLSRIKKEEIEKYVKQVGYGNQDISDTNNFWNESTLKISPIEQVELLRKLYTYELPFSKSNVDTVKAIMKVIEQDNIVLSAKTGSGVIDNKSINGWFIGYVEKGEQVYIFATNIKGKENADGRNAREITLSILQGKNIL